MLKQSLSSDFPSILARSAFPVFAGTGFAVHALAVPDIEYPACFYGMFVVKREQPEASGSEEQRKKR